MTNLLGKAFDEASRLSGPEQDTFAAWILEELASERRWESAFADSSEALDQLADEALREHREARTHILDPNAL